jgi:hypothetical protein
VDQFGKDFERRGVELTQHAAQLIEDALPCPDQILVSAGGDLDRVGERDVGLDFAVVVSVEAGDRSKGARVALVGLRAGG